MKPNDIADVLNQHKLWCDGAGGKRANLTRAYLADANLVGADLTNANLVGADLTNANLVGANLTDANLTRITLCGANIDGAVLAENALAGLGHILYVLTDEEAGVIRKMRDHERTGPAAAVCR